MKNRSSHDYIGLDTRSALANKSLSSMEQNGIKKLPNSSFPFTLSDFFSSNIFGWAKTLIPGKPYTYPDSITNKPIIMHNANGMPSPIVIGIAADWATATEQSQYISDCIREKGINKEVPDYTIHLGDTYYSGTESEIELSFGKGGDDSKGMWPRGAVGTFALAGNHEMYTSGGYNYYQMITGSNRNFGTNNIPQGAPVFCLTTDHWCIIGLDTGYQSVKKRFLGFEKDNTGLCLEKAVIDWLKNVVNLKNETRGIILLSHHQYSTAFKGEEEYQNPASQLIDDDMLPPGREVIWIWGHEHRFAMYGKYQLSPKHITAYGRCIGNGGMPDEISVPDTSVNTDEANTRKLVLYDSRIADTFNTGDEDDDSNDKTNVGFNGYVVMTLDNEIATIDYYASYKGDDFTNHTISDAIGLDGKDEKIFTEIWQVNNTNGMLICNQVIDYHTATYYTDKVPIDVSK